MPALPDCERCSLRVSDGKSRSLCNKARAAWRRPGTNRSAFFPWAWRKVTRADVSKRSLARPLTASPAAWFAVGDRGFGEFCWFFFGIVLGPDGGQIVTGDPLDD